MKNISGLVFLILGAGFLLLGNLECSAVYTSAAVILFNMKQG